MFCPKKHLPVLLACSLWFLLCGCEGKKKFPDTPNYKLSEPRVIPLPTALDEISGIAYYPPDTSVFAIIDEAGTLFKISLNDPKRIKQWTFDKKRDYEELVLVDSTFYVLVSKGDIVSIKFENDSSITTKSDFGKGGKSKNEFESMIYIGDNKLVIICKECKDDSKEVLSSYTYNISENAYTPFIQFDVKQILNDRQMKGRFKPSVGCSTVGSCESRNTRFAAVAATVYVLPSTSSRCWKNTVIVSLSPWRRIINWLSQRLARLEGLKGVMGLKITTRGPLRVLMYTRGLVAGTRSSVNLGCLSHMKLVWMMPG